MTELIFANNASSTTAGSISNTDTLVNISAGTGVLFPQPVGDQMFIATLIDQTTGTVREIIHVTNVNADALTIVRAQENTSAQNWPAGSIIAHLHTAGAMQSFLQDVDMPTNSLVYFGDDVSTVVNSIIVSATVPPLSALVPNAIFNINIKNTNTGPATLLIPPATMPSPIVRADNTPILAGDININQKALLIFTGSAFQLANFKMPASVGDGSVGGVKGTFPTDFWAGLITGTETEFQFHVRATIPFPYPGGVMVSGLTSFDNIGEIRVSVNAQQTVNLIHQDGTPYKGHEFPHKGTMLNIMSDGTDFRSIGTLALTDGDDSNQGGPPGDGSGGGSGPVNPPEYKFGDFQSNWWSIAFYGSYPGLPGKNANFIQTDDLILNNWNGFGDAWYQLCSIYLPWFPNPGYQVRDDILCGYYQRMEVPPGTGKFRYGDIGSIFVDRWDLGAGVWPDSRCRGTQELTGFTKEHYGPEWQPIGSFRIYYPDWGYGGGLTNYGSFMTFYQRTDLANNRKHGEIGSIYMDMSRSGSNAIFYVNQGDYYYWWNDSFFYTGRRMGEFGGTWMKVGAFSIQQRGGFSQGGSSQGPDCIVIDFFQRIA